MAEMDLELFKKSINAMIVKNGHSWEDWARDWRFRKFSREYTREEVEKILSSNDIKAM
jgi:hypothetical protein